VVEGARLESVYTVTYRGFESLPHRQEVFSSHCLLGIYCINLKEDRHAGREFMLPAYVHFC
jgi:hypothetical protein